MNNLSHNSSPAPSEDGRFAFGAHKSPRSPLALGDERRPWGERQFSHLSAEERQAWYDLECAAELRRLNKEHNVIEHISELKGWEIKWLERWKPGVVRYHAIRHCGTFIESKIGYAKDEVFAHLQIKEERS